jgi:hypothetical protein
MNSFRYNAIFRRTLGVVCCGFALATSSAWATLVTWQLNPTSANAPVGSTSQLYTVSGYSITAYGYDNNSGTGVPHELFFKNAGSSEFGLGLTNTPHNELQADANGNPLHFIQLDISSILSQGFINGKIEVGSVQSGELFSLYGSNSLGSLGVKLNSSPYDSSKDGVFVSVPQFGTYKFISVVAAAADVLPIAFQASIVPIPEAASVVPVLCLVIAATALEVRRRRRAMV